MMGSARGSREASQRGVGHEGRGSMQCSTSMTPDGGARG
jgi:hypothetical protein